MTYSLPINKETEDYVRSFIKRSIGYGGLGMLYYFYIPEHVMGNLSANDILIIAGYHPQGYGGALEVEKKEGVVRITSSANCD